VILTHVCNTGMSDLSDLAELKNKELLLGGIVTKFREGMTKRGDPYGIITMEDFTGSGEIPLFGNDFVNYGKYGKQGMYLYVKAFVENRYERNEVLRIKSISLLQDEKSKLLTKLSIVAPISELTATLVEDLHALLKNNLGTATLQFDIIDEEQQNVFVNLSSKTFHVEITQKLIDALSDIKNIHYKIN